MREIHLEPQDFRNQKDFPGTLDNSFDVVLRRFDDIEKIHPIFFALILVLIAAIAGRGRLEFSLALLGFFLLDWLLLALLPVYKKSFGPAKPSVLILAVLRLFFGLLPVIPALAFQVAGTLMVIYGFWIEPQRLRLTRMTLESSKLPSGARFSLLHLGDYHLERITKRERDLNAIIAREKPDLILFSGDVLNLSYNDDPLAIEQARQMLQGWKAPMGTYAVSGSEAVDLDSVFPVFFQGTPLQRLTADTIFLRKEGGIRFSLTGLSCSHRPFRDKVVLSSLAKPQNNLFSILLYHSPDLAPDAAQLGFDLQLSGHTHGGQICVPGFGPFFTASLYGRIFQSGAYQLGKMVLYITRGIGMEGKAAPRVRFFCPPEVILWDIIGTGAEITTS